MLHDMTPGTPVWVRVSPRRRLLGRVVQVYRPAGRRIPRVLVRLAEDYGAYQRGSTAVFMYPSLLRRDVDRRKERPWGLSERLTQRWRRSDRHA